MLTDKVKVLELIPNHLTPHMVQQLATLLYKLEIHQAHLQMANGKSTRPNGILTEFLKCFWNLINDAFFDMIQSSISQGSLPIGMTLGTITLFFKAGDRANLANWRPITLLNASYKIEAKALQIRLQHLLHDVINPE